MKTIFAAIAAIAIFGLASAYLPKEYDQHGAIMYGIAAADYRPSVAKELIESTAKDKYPSDSSFQSKFVDDALGGYYAEQHWKK